MKRGQKHSDLSRQRISEGHCGQIPWNKGKAGRPLSADHRSKIGNALRGRPLAAETKQKLSKSHAGKRHTAESKLKNRIAHLGRPGYWTCKHRSDETKRRISEAKCGVSVNRREQNPNWRGGISSTPYPLEWTPVLRRRIRERDGYACRLCGEPQDDSRVFPVHHIDYCKAHCDPTNLLTLCPSCHSRTNTNRKRWMEFFAFRYASGL